MDAGLGRPGVTYRFDGFHGRTLYELNGLPEEIRNGPPLECLWLSAPFRVCSVNGDEQRLPVAPSCTYTKPR